MCIHCSTVVYKFLLFNISHCVKWFLFFSSICYIEFHNFFLVTYNCNIYCVYFIFISVSLNVICCFVFFLCVFFQFFFSLVLVFSFPVWTSSLVSFYILNTRFVLYFFFFTCTASVHFSKNFSRIRSVEGEKNKQHILCFFFLCVCMCTTLPNHKNVHSFLLIVFTLLVSCISHGFLFFSERKSEKKQQ